MTATLIAAQGWCRRRPDAQFSLRFLVLVSCIPLAHLALGPFWPEVISATSRAVVWMSRAAGLPAGAGRGGTTWFGGRGFSYVITRDCTAVTLGGLFAAAVLAYPASWRERTIGLAAGLPALSLLNLLRLVSLGWIGVHAPSAFQVVHAFWYEALLIFVAGLGWLLWVRFAVAPANLRDPAAYRRRVLPALGAFVAVLVGTAALGALTPAPRIYTETVAGVATMIARLVSTQESVVVRFGGDTDLFFFGALAGVAALFLAAPGVSSRTRVRGLLRRGLPAVLTAQVLYGEAMLLLIWAGRSHSAWTGPTAGPAHLLDLVAGMAPVAVWFHWVRRTTDRRPASSRFRNQAAAHRRPSGAAARGR